MRKITAMAFILAFTFTAAACGHTAATGSKPAPSTESGSTTAVQKMEASEGDFSASKPGTIFTGTEGLELDTVYEDTALNLVKETGPIRYTINGFQVSRAAVTDEDIAGEMELLPGQEFSIVAFSVTVENTTDRPASIYFSESSPSLTTNTEKDIMPDMWLSDAITEDYEPHEVKNGVIVFAMLESKAAKIRSAALTVSAPYDTVTYEDAGEETTVEFSW